MTVRIYPVVNEYIAGVEVEGRIRAVGIKRKRRWTDKEALRQEILARGYAEVEPDTFELQEGAYTYGGRGRPASLSLEEIATRSY